MSARAPNTPLQAITCRTNHESCSTEKVVLKSVAKFTGQQLCRSFFFYKVAGWKTATLLKRRLQHRFFPVNFAEFFYGTPLCDCFCIQYELLYSWMPEIVGLVF